MPFRKSPPSPLPLLLLLLALNPAAAPAKPAGEPAAQRPAGEPAAKAPVGEPNAKSAAGEPNAGPPADELTGAPPAALFGERANWPAAEPAGEESSEPADPRFAERAAAAKRDKIYGFDLDTLAYATAKATAFSTQYGSAQGEANFELWLRQQGLDRVGYDAAYDTFLKHFEADPTGSLEESYFAALDRYAPNAKPPDLQDQAGPELARQSGQQRVDAAYGASAWPSASGQAPGGNQADSQLRTIDELLAESQARTSSAYLALQEATAKQNAAQFERFRKGNLPVSEEEPASPPPEEKAPAAQPEQKAPASPRPPQPAASAITAALSSASPEAIAPLAAALDRGTEAERRAAARPFAWWCDLFTLVPPAQRDSDPRTPYCHPAAVRQLWLPAALDILAAAPEKDLHLVPGLLDYFKLLGFAAESKAALASLLERLEAAENAAAQRLGSAKTPVETILEQSRLRDLKEAKEQVQKALGKEQVD